MSKERREYIAYLQKVSKQLDDHNEKRLVGNGWIKCVGLCHAISVCSNRSEEEEEFRGYLEAEIEKVRQRKNVFYAFQDGKTDDDDQFLWHPTNYKVRKKFLTGLIHDQLNKSKY
tara:strand:- start:47808 stop:48152 length:345 start_codon:yes stop_codon:yes gene_type:complete